MRGLFVARIERPEDRPGGNPGEQFGEQVCQRRPTKQAHDYSAEHDGGLNAPTEIPPTAMPPTVTAPTNTVKPIASPI
jgi:hypothetical protein